MADYRTDRDEPLAGGRAAPKPARPDPALRACVVIPARDEADGLPTTLRALADQRDGRGGRLPAPLYEVIVLANHCTDSTAEVARRWARDEGAGLVVHVFERDWPPGEAHVGTARRWLMDLACDRLEAAGRPRGVIASTDADTRVAPGWLAATLSEVAAGADAVAGVVEVDRGDLRRLGPEARRAYWRDRVYRRLVVELEALVDPNPLDPAPRHDFHGGASLAITPEAYRRVGGLPPRPWHEDVALAEALWRVDARFVHSPRVRVRTSGRRVGRAAGGLSADLDRWSGPAAVALACDPRAVEGELRARRALRRWFEARAGGDWPPGPARVAELARTLGVEPAPLLDELSGFATFGLWLEAARRLRTGGPAPWERPPVPIDRAIDLLRARVRAIRAGSG